MNKEDASGFIPAATNKEYKCSAPGCYVKDCTSIDGSYIIKYCSRHATADEMLEMLKRAKAALQYAERYFGITVSQSAEMWSFVNGYPGDQPDIDTVLAKADKGKVD
jgi:hypothetical protein